MMQQGLTKCMEPRVGVEHTTCRLGFRPRFISPFYRNRKLTVIDVLVETGFSLR